MSHDEPGDDWRYIGEPNEHNSVDFARDRATGWGRDAKTPEQIPLRAE